MNKSLLFLAVVLFLSLPALSQTTILLKGKISADSLQGSSVHVINLTQKTVTLSSSTGNFEIEVSENDILLFSSIEYERKEVAITAEIIKAAFLEVQLVVDVNELEIVNLSNTALTGNLNTDLDKIETVKDLPVGFAIDFMNARFKSDFTDPLREPENLAFQQNNVMQETPVNLIAVAGLITDLLGIKTREKVKLPPGFYDPLSIQIRKLFTDDFFITSLKIKEERIKHFLFYLDDQAIDRQLLFEKNRMALIEFLIDHSENYRSINSEY